MKIDLTLSITPQMAEDARNNPKKELEGHLGTHFDVMNKVFPLDYTQRKAVVFDVSHVREREISLEDVDMSRIEPEMFVAFHTGFGDEEEYGTQRYFKESPQLSMTLIEALVAKKISIIGVDCGGVRRGKEHIPTDQYCADHGVFVVENLRCLNQLPGDHVVIHTYPMAFTHLTGLPCRVVAEV